MKTFANFTFIDGIRGNEYELHATGCRDLKHLPGTSIRFQVEAENAAAAEAGFQEEAPGAQVFLQACCNPRRMAAAGRIRMINATAADVAPAYLAGISFPVPTAPSVEGAALETEEAVVAPKKAKKGKKSKAA
jgi:hypothetical protein